MYKLVTFAGYDHQTGPHIFAIEPDRERTIGHIKMARSLPPKVEHYIRTARPIPGKTQLLIDALGAGEYYGSNSNGDYFPEEALRHPGAEYGYETFMHYAYPYKHHVNKDPARSYGDKVTLSEYDPEMHRVLLIVRVDDSKCQDIIGDLTQGRYWSVSMGCRVPWDECSICKNRAKNRGEYCPHLRYQMNRILQDGRRVCAINRLPKFFDISFVTIGAEKASHVLKKVASASSGQTPSSAELGESYYAKLSSATKKAVQKKRADIDKDVPSQPPANISGVTPEDKAKLQAAMADAGEVKPLEAPIPTGTLSQLAKHPLPEVFSTMAAMGIDLRPHEFQRIILIKQGAAQLADALDRHHLMFDERNHGPTPSWANQIHWNPGAVSEKVGMLLQPYVASRSCYPEILLGRLERMEKRAELEGYNRDSKWYPMTDEGRRASSGISGLIPASAALAVGFLAFKNMFPDMIQKGPGALKLFARHPWLLPVLVGAGVGTSVNASMLSEGRPLSPHGTGSGLDGIKHAAYHGAKTASAMNPLTRVGLIPMAYIYAGIQQKRWQRGEQLNAVDRFIARRPDLAGLASFAAGPSVARSLKRLTKHGSALGNVALYTIGTSSKLMPAVLAGAALDTAILTTIGRLAARKGNKKHGNAW